MKLDSISDRDILIDHILLEEAPLASGIFLDTGDDDIEQSYKQLEILQAFFATGNPGVFIGRQLSQLKEGDIIIIKNNILEMTSNNRFLEGMNFKGHDGEENFALIGHGIGHAIEFTLLTALTGVLAGVAGEEALHGDAILAALSGAGAIATGYGIHKQVATIKALWAAYRLSHILSKYNDYTTYEPKTYRRGLIKTFLDWIEGKTPEQIRQESIRRVQTESTRKQMEFERAINHLPKFVTVRGNDGENKRVAMTTFFDFN